MIISPLPFVIYHPPSIINHSVIFITYHPPSIINHPSTFYHTSPAVNHQPSTNTSNRRHPFSKKTSPLSLVIDHPFSINTVLHLLCHDVLHALLQVLAPLFTAYRSRQCCLLHTPGKAGTLLQQTNASHQHRLPLEHQHRVQLE